MAGRELERAVQEALLADALDAAHFSRIFGLLGRIRDQEPDYSPSPALLEILFDLCTRVFTFEQYSYLRSLLKVIAASSHIEGLALGILCYGVPEEPSALGSGGGGESGEFQAGEDGLSYYVSSAALSPSGRAAALLGPSTGNQQAGQTGETGEAVGPERQGISWSHSRSRSPTRSPTRSPSRSPARLFSQESAQIPVDPPPRAPSRGMPPRPAIRSNRLYFQTFSFPESVSPAQRLAYLIVGLVTPEVYQFSRQLFHAAVLAIEGLTFHPLGRRLFSLCGAAEALAECVGWLHESCAGYDFTAPRSEARAALDPSPSQEGASPPPPPVADEVISLSLLETLSNILSLRSIRLMSPVSGFRIVDSCSSRMRPALVRALQTSQTASQYFAVLSCLLPCCLESRQLFDAVCADEGCVHSIVRAVECGPDGGATFACILLLLMVIRRKLETRGPSPLGPGEELVAAQEAAGPPLTLLRLLLSLSAMAGVEAALADFELCDSKDSESVRARLRLDEEETAAVRRRIAELEAELEGGSRAGDAFPSPQRRSSPTRGSPFRSGPQFFGGEAAREQGAVAVPTVPVGRAGAEGRLGNWEGPARVLKDI